jgi:hypothetical protein
MTVVAAGDGYAIAEVSVDETLEVDDPRLSGHLTGDVFLLTTLDADRPGEVESTVFEGSVRIDDEDGAWVGTMRAAYSADLTTPHQVLALTGTGAYAGCALIMFITGFDGGTGVIYPVGVLKADGSFPR